MERKFDFIEVTLEPEKYDMVKEVYRLHKEQANKIFDLGCGIQSNEDIMKYIKSKIEYDVVLLVIDTTNDKYAGVIILDKIDFYNETIARANCHIVINKMYWGKGSRNIIKDCYEFLKENFKPINRLEAKVPCNNFGIIKLLKDVGFKIEGTLRDRLIFNNKNGTPTYYNELVYGNINLGE